MSFCPEYPNTCFFSALYTATTLFPFVLSFITPFCSSISIMLFTSSSLIFPIAFIILTPSPLPLFIASCAFISPVSLVSVLPLFITCSFFSLLSFALFSDANAGKFTMFITKHTTTNMLITF